jgi:hypothetical protein
MASDEREGRMAARAEQAWIVRERVLGTVVFAVYTARFGESPDGCEGRYDTREEAEARKAELLNPESV